MPTVFDFDAYLRQHLAPKFGTLGQVARHKLLYSVHRCAIAHTGKPAFVARCEAWELGPVFPELYFNSDLSGNPAALTSKQRGFCDLVARVLGAQSGRSLAARSHGKFPEWYLARKNRTNNEITIDAIREQLSLIGWVPPNQQKRSHIQK